MCAKSRRLCLAAAAPVIALAAGGMVWRAACPAPTRAEPAALRRLRDEGSALYRQGRYVEADRVFEKGLREARKHRHAGAIIRFLSNVGGCQMTMFRYREALSAYTEARQLAEKTGDREAAIGIAVNTSALYLYMGDLDAALQTSESGMVLIQDQATAKYRVPLLLQTGKLRARTGQTKAAIALFRQAIEVADRQNDVSAKAQALQQIGVELLRKKDLAGAEAPLLEAYRLRKASRDPAALFSSRTLGLLRLAKKDSKSASRLFEEALAAARAAPNSLPLWVLYHDRGRALLAQGRLAEAVADFEKALETAPEWRTETLPADSFRIGIETKLDMAYASFIEAAMRLYFQSGRRDLARRSFEAAEESRAASLRALLAPDDWRQRLPAEYSETLVRYRGATARALAEETPQAQAELRRLRRLLTEMEARAGLESEPGNACERSETLLEQTRASLGPGEAYLSFHLGETESVGWAVTREGFEARRLPSGTEIERQAADVLAAARSDAPAAERVLYSTLFGGFHSVAAKAHWLLGLEGRLFEIPFPTLTLSSAGGRPVFLIERHSLQIVPSAHLLVAASGTRPATPPAGGLFLGVGDPIYNGADPRWRPASRSARPQLELARLPGSGREIRTCAALANGAENVAMLLEGTAASPRELRNGLERRPAVVHFAAHVVPARDNRSVIALSLSSTGEAQLLGPAEIASWRVGPSLVVLSGCSSGRGEALPGTGLMGLTRAWLAAGANGVVASLWPTPDDSGELFVAFYKHLKSQNGLCPRPDAALQQAQMEMLRSSTWRSRPRYWGAYFMFGRG